MNKLATHCPFCGGKLYEVVGQYSVNHIANDHKYTNQYDPDVGWTEELIVDGKTYYQSDVAKVCKLKAFT